MANITGCTGRHPKKRLMPQHAFALCRLKIPLNLTWQPPRRMRAAPLRWIMQKESNEIRSSIPDAWTLLRMTSIYEEKTQQNHIRQISNMKIEFSVEHIMKIIIEREVSEDKAYQITNEAKLNNHV